MKEDTRLHSLFTQIKDKEGKYFAFLIALRFSQRTRQEYYYLLICHQILPGSY